ncbi:MAG: hypothetical protein N2712_02650 [Brevinematales bacterium]|nr:hypothetical protein [Brevinematales bacterium]
MNIRNYIKSSIILSGFTFVIILIVLYFLTVFLNQNLSPQSFEKYLVLFGIPLYVISLSSGLIIAYIYFFKYRKFLKEYHERYKVIVSKVFGDLESRKTSLLENLLKGTHKDESGIFSVLPEDDEFGDFGRMINIMLSNVYHQDIEKSRLLSYQKEVISKLISFVDIPIIILRKIHQKKPSVIVANLNLEFLKAIKTENVVKLAVKLMDRFKIKQHPDKYLYDTIFDIIRSRNSEDIEEIFTGQEIGIEEFLVEVDWFLHPVDDRSKKIISVLKELVRGSDLTDLDINTVLDILNYSEYRKRYGLPEALSKTDILQETQGLIPTVVPEDESSFIKTKQISFYREGLTLENFKFSLANNEVIFNSTIKIFPATSKHFSPEKMLIIQFIEIKTLHTS